MTFLWLETLESRFPGFEQNEPKAGKEKDKANENVNVNEKEKQKPKLNVKNTVAKIVVDQVVGGAWNTVAFIATMGFLRGYDYEVIKDEIANVGHPLFQAIRLLTSSFLPFP